MKIIKPLSYLILVLLSLPVIAQTTLKTSGSSDIKTHFQQAKKEYLAFEREHGRYVQTPSVRMHYLTWGDPKNTCVIWAHGSLTSSYEVMNIAKRITDAGYYLIAIDYYGHGKTPIPDKEVSLYHTADDIMVLMDSLKIKKAVIGGFSRGGYIAAAFYQSYPERVKALILEDGGSVAFNTFNHRMTNTDLDKKIKAGVLSKEADQLYNGTYNSEIEAYQSLYDPSLGGSQFEILSTVKLQNDKWVTYAGLSNFFGMGDEDQYRSLILKPNNLPLYAASITMVQPKIIFRDLKVPLLIFDPVSTNDPMPFEKDNIALANQFPKLITRIEYKDIEHNIHYAEPEKFSNDVIRFLNAVSR